MRHLRVYGRRLLLWLGLSIVLALLLEGLRLMMALPFSWIGLAARWAFVAGVLFGSREIQPYPFQKSLYIWPWPGGLIVGIGVGTAAVYVKSGATWAAWGLLASLYALLLGSEKALIGGRSVLRRWGARVLLALVGGAVPVAISQVDSHFADKEFFVELQALALGLFWGLLLAARHLLDRHWPTSARHGLRFDRRQLALALVLMVFVGSCAIVRAYQQSFYPLKSPPYEGISPETPFLCGEAPPDPQVFDGEEVFRRLLARVEANPRAGPPEYGMLALGTGERRWAQAFRQSLLAEAVEGRFVGPAHSVKSVQFEAALRAYYFPRVRDAFPDLFSDDDLVRIRNWFAAINRRALTVEWVDWMYALAFTKWPEGPYENQENGAGLLALLESEGLADPDLSLANRDYLERDRRGWIARFRNTDDAYIYQPEWLYNAYFQSLYTGGIPTNNVRLSFEWLLLQSLPDGAPLRYNHPGSLSLAGIAYVGARLLNDPRYVWLAGRALANAEARDRVLFASPGADKPVPLSGHSPVQGSCLLYGDSGLPTRKGPLAPDKIVFRDGWQEDSAYLLLNLRFTGWHRYKATNTVALIYRKGPLAADVLDGQPFSWLPKGRSLFRDKRIPRENLNGLLVERTGMSAVLYHLTGIGGPWAQDPPYYAEVVAFETGEDLDWSHTRITNWRGWQHDRWIYFHHNGGPIVVVDEAKGPPGRRAAIVWHLIGDGVVDGNRIWLRGGEHLVEVQVIPLSPGRLSIIPGGDSGRYVVYYVTTEGYLRVMMVVTPKEERVEKASWTIRVHSQ